MKLNEKDLKLVIENIINNNSEFNTDELNETNFQLDANDPKLQQKVNDIKNNTAIFDKTKDVVIVGDGVKKTVESVYSKSDIINLMNEAKTKKRKASSDDYMKAVKKADREMEYELKGPGWKAKDKMHKNKSKYDRKHMASDDLDESVFTKGDIEKLILEKKYNGKVYSKTELIEMLQNNE